MSAYTYFQLHSAPFDGHPDPRFYFRTPSHSEALATAQFTLRARKACTVILGESGSGKSLLARLLAESVDSRTRVLWINGLGQPADSTETFIECRTPAPRLDRPPDHRVVPTTLSSWRRAYGDVQGPTLIIADNADGLRLAHWTELLAVLASEYDPARPVTLCVFGLPGVATTLAQVDLVRLRRRVFRTCALGRLDRDAVGGYVQHRLRTAGAGPEREVFTPAALDLIHRLSCGNPALVNQLCDNALLDAYSDERQTIDSQHVFATVQAIAGVRTQPALPEPLSPQPILPEADGLMDDLLLEIEADGPLPEPIETCVAPVPAVEPPHEIGEIPAAFWKQEIPPPPAPPAENPLNERLSALGRCLSAALTRVRATRDTTPVDESATNEAWPVPPIDHASTAMLEPVTQAASAD